LIKKIYKTEERKNDARRKKAISPSGRIWVIRSANHMAPDWSWLVRTAGSWHIGPNRSNQANEPETPSNEGYALDGLQMRHDARLSIRHHARPKKEKPAMRALCRMTSQKKKPGTMPGLLRFAKLAD
jgi:hypothetical protein